MGKDETTYVLDKEGAISPELVRFAEVQSMIHLICQNSRVIGEATVGLRAIVSRLCAESQEREPGDVFEFPGEIQAREDLLQVADFLKRINFKLWTVSRNLGADLQVFADKVTANEDAKISADLDSFLSALPVSDAGDNGK